MLEAYRVVLVLHVATAVVSLVSFWVALGAGKGGRRHLAAGRLYVRAMAVMLGSALALATALAAAPSVFAPAETPAQLARPGLHGQEVRSFGVVLAGVALLAGSLLAFGARAPKRLGTTLAERRTDLALVGTPGLIGAIALPFSRVPGWDALDGIGVVLLVASACQVHRIVRPAAWITEHLVGLLGSGVVIHGALVTNLLLRMVPGTTPPQAFRWSAWVVPIGVSLVVWACRRTAPKRAPRGLDAVADLLAELP